MTGETIDTLRRLQGVARYYSTNIYVMMASIKVSDAFGLIATTIDELIERETTNEDSNA